MKIAVIGCGSQGSALIRGLSKTGLDLEIRACDVQREKRNQVENHAHRVFKEAELAVKECDIVFLAVKPKHVDQVLNSVHLSGTQLLVSVAAGVPIPYLQEGTEAEVARVMPNLAAEHREMAVAVAYSRDVGKDSRRFLEEVLEELGTVVELDEEVIDLATAVNGSGPAFVYYLMNLFKQVASKRIPGREAEKLVVQTFKGAAELADSTDKDLDELIDSVCSEGGTTIEGMDVLRDSDVEQVMEDTIQVTAEKSEKISRQYS